MNQVYGYHEGNRSEYLALYALSAMGFATPVPRQSDFFGVDIIVHLAQREGRLLIPSGKCFGVQVKSEGTPLAIGRSHFACFHGLTIPFFLAIVSKDGLTLRVYATLPRFGHHWMGQHGISLELIPGKGTSNLEPLDSQPASVYLGDPIVEIKLHELDAKEDRLRYRKLFHDIMDSWVILENSGIAWREQEIPLYESPDSYSTNEVPTTEIKLVTRFANIKSLDRICRAIQPGLYSLSWYIKVAMEQDKTDNPISDDLKKRITSLDAAVREVRALCKQVYEQLRGQIASSAGKAP